MEGQDVQAHNKNSKIHCNTREGYTAIQDQWYMHVYIYLCAGVCLYLCIVYLYIHMHIRNNNYVSSCVHNAVVKVTWKEPLESNLLTTGIITLLF